MSTDPSPETNPILDRYQWDIKRAKLLVELRVRGATDIQVFIQPNPRGEMRVQFRNKWTCEQWSMTPEACDEMVAALPPTFTFDRLIGAIKRVPGTITLAHPLVRGSDKKRFL